MSGDWNNLLFAFLHDPPDKALRIKGHEERAKKYFQMASHLAPPNDWKDQSDRLASIAERLPMPSAGEKGERAVNPEDGKLTVFHPLSASKSSLTVANVNVELVLEKISEIVEGLGARNSFLALWRVLPERLAEKEPCFARLPADTRLPDHTIWHHLDITAGLKGAEGVHGKAFLSFAIGPVQSFIKTARSVRDLWSGSMILSWLTFNGILPIIEGDLMVRQPGN